MKEKTVLAVVIANSDLQHNSESVAEAPPPTAIAAC